MFVCTELNQNSAHLFAADDALRQVNDISRLLAHRDEMIQTAILEYVRTDKTADNRTVATTDGTEAYRRNRAYSRESMCWYQGVTNKIVKITSWDGTFAYIYEPTHNMALVSKSGEPGVLPSASVFYETTFRHLHEVFRLDYADNTIHTLVNDLLFFRRPNDALHIPGPVISAETIQVDNINHRFKRITFVSKITKQIMQVVECDNMNGFCPSRVVTYYGDFPCVEIIASDIKEVMPGVSLPFNIKCTSYELNSRKPCSFRETKLNKLLINDKIDDSIFTPKFQPGTQIINKCTGTISTVQ